MSTLSFVDTQQTPAHFNERGNNDGKGWYYRQPETGKVFRALGWNQLLKAVHAHRSGMASTMDLDLAGGWMERLEDEMCREGSHDRRCHDKANPGEWVSEVVEAGMRLWKELHAHALAYPLSPSEVEVVAERRWLLDWEGRIPNFSCNCKSNFELITRVIPPVFTGRKDYYLWTVRVHNAVNQKLGKAEWMIPEEAASLLQE